MRLLGVNIVVFLGLVLAAEAALRAMGWQSPGYFSNLTYENDPIAGPWHTPSQVAFVHAPCFRVDAVHVNRFGMRDRERALDATALRIALVGDSFTEGLQVEDDETVSRRLESLLRDRAEVLNFGVSSTGTSAQLLNYRKRVRPFRPDVVILMFFAGNDVQDNLPALKQRVDPVMAAVSPYFLLDSNGVLKDAPEPGRFERTSPLIRLVGLTVVGQWAYQMYQAVRVTVASTRVAAAPGVMAPAADLEDAWKITEQVLLRFHREVTTDGGRFGVVVIPSNDAVVSRSVADRLSDVSRRGPFPVVDLGSIFADRVGPDAVSPFSFPCDAHWNSRGHNEAAVALRAFLDEQRWLVR
jgi:lysophospholipase L1-like esterase